MFFAAITKEKSNKIIVYSIFLAISHTNYGSIKLVNPYKSAYNVEVVKNIALSHSHQLIFIASNFPLWWVHPFRAFFVKERMKFNHDLLTQNQTCK